MAAEFNPYHVWLGIPPEDQPANHYRLLSLRQFENDADVIDSAADRQTAHLRTFQSGKHGNLTQRLLNEVATARVCLLDPKKRAVYDQQLRPALTASAPQAAEPWSDLLGDPSAKPARTPGAKSVASAKAGAAKQDAKNRMVSIAIAAGVVLIAGLAFGIYSLSGSNVNSDGTLVFDWPDRADVAVKVDNAPIEVPAAGAWEHNFPAGPHHVTAQRPAYKFAADVNLDAGQRLSVTADWRPKAVLALNWPAGLRSGAVLKIDGRGQAISQHDPLEVPVEPGRHAIQITRPGFNPINTSVLIAADARELVAIAAPPADAKLVFDWPAGDREDAELTVDGTSREIADNSDSEPLALTLEPGRHVVRITRRGFEPFNQSVDLSAGTDSQIKPTWTPEKKTAVAPTVAETTAPVEVEPTPPAKKTSIPTDADQEKIARASNEPQKASPSGPDTAANQPAAAANTVGLNCAVKEYALAVGQPSMQLTRAIGGFCCLSSISGHFASYGEGVGVGWTKNGFWSLEAHSGGDSLSARALSIEPLVPTVFKRRFKEYVWRNGAPSVKMLHKSAGICFLSAIEGRFEGNGEEVSVRLKEDGYWYLDCKSGQKELGARAIGVEWATPGAYSIDTEDHKWSAGDPPVNLLTKGQGFALLSAVSGHFAGLGEEVRVYLGDDGVWHLAGKSGQKSLSAMATAIRVSKASPGDSAPPQGTPALAGADKSTGAAAFAPGKWVDVLPLVDTAKGIGAGNWSRNGSEISCDAKGVAKIGIPVVVDGSYEMEVDFTRTAGDADVNTIFTVGSHQCMVKISGEAGGSSGISRIDGRDGHEQGNPTRISPGTLENNRRYRLLVRTTATRVGRASIDVSLDGKRYLPHWEGDLASLGTEPAWQLPNPNELGLALYKDRVTFHSVRLKMTSGRATVDVSALESAPAQSASASALPTIIKARWGRRKTWVDVTAAVKEAVAKGEIVYANSGFLKVDSTEGKKKQLQITYKLGETEQATNVKEGGKWSKDDYGKPAAE